MVGYFFNKPRIFNTNVLNGIEVLYFYFRYLIFFDYLHLQPQYCSLENIRRICCQSLLDILYRAKEEVNSYLERYPWRVLVCLTVGQMVNIQYNGKLLVDQGFKSHLVFLSQLINCVINCSSSDWLWQVSFDSPIISYGQVGAPALDWELTHTPLYPSGLFAFHSCEPCSSLTPVSFPLYHRMQTYR